MQGFKEKSFTAVQMAEDMFRAPTHYGMRVLDRSKFQKFVQLKAARVLDNKNISKIRQQLERSKDILQQERLASIQPDPDTELAKAGRKCILLRPEVATANVSPTPETNGAANGNHANQSAEPRPHSSTVSELINQNLVSVIPFTVHLTYPYWTYHDIISSILPPDEQGEIPSGFQQVGHVAHLNLRDGYLKHKTLIAQILMHKNPSVRTVINKIDDVGEESEYRTFKYEVLAGPDDMHVTISEEGCTFKFDYSKVYWNSRLNTEHRRIVESFKPGEAVCDVMAGIGPFAVPAGKRGCFVYANDLNPESFACLEDAVKRNKVGGYVKAFNEDGRDFIKRAVRELATTDSEVKITTKLSKKELGAKSEVVRTTKAPKHFQHFVLNLPASAVTFLSSFVGVYAQLSVKEQLSSLSRAEMPLIHVYTFSTKSDNNVAEGYKICENISKQLGHEMKPGKIDVDGDAVVEIFDVRDVAPKKRMFCASFRLPREVAFRLD